MNKQFHQYQWDERLEADWRALLRLAADEEQARARHERRQGKTSHFSSSGRSATRAGPDLRYRAAAVRFKVQ